MTSPRSSPSPRETDSADPRRRQHSRLRAHFRLRAACRSTRMARRSTERPGARRAALVEPARLPSTRHQSARVRSAGAGRFGLATSRGVARLRVGVDPGAVGAVSRNFGGADRAGLTDRKFDSRYPARGARDRPWLRRRIDGWGFRAVSRAALGESARGVAGRPPPPAFSCRPSGCGDAYGRGRRGAERPLQFRSRLPAPAPCRSGRSLAPRLCPSERFP